tara:strand:+ start:640 stop:1284 length:645 start_codon:yes stop_codon:yes gene_type:complete
LALALSLPLALVCVVGGKVRALMEDDETLCHEERWKMTLDGVSDWRKHAAMADVADAVSISFCSLTVCPYEHCVFQVSRRNKKAWPSFLGVRAGSGVAAASGALVLFLLASFLAVVALDVGGGPKEGTSGDQLRDYVEVSLFLFPHGWVRMGNCYDVVFHYRLTLRIRTSTLRRSWIGSRLWRITSRRLASVCTTPTSRYRSSITCHRVRRRRW